MRNKIEKLQFADNIYNTIRRNTRKYCKEKGLTSALRAEMVDLSLGVSLDQLIEKRETRD